MAKLKLPLWTLEQGLEIVRQLQPETRQFGYHLTLGGGVLNEGFSHKDLDLFFIPLDNKDEPANHAAMHTFLSDLWGAGEDLLDPKYAAMGLRIFAYKWEYAVENKRIDVFILRSHNGEGS